MAPTVQDHGWAWMVLLGAHIGLVLTSGFLQSLGVFYIEWKEFFDLTATDASWLVSVPFLVASPLCFFTGILATRVGIRHVAIVGAAITGLSTVLGSIASNITQLYIFNGLTGVGLVMTVSPGTIMISRYFKERYTFATGVVLLGVNVGQMVFPRLIRLLVVNYGWRGAMFIIGALQMNGVAACALFRPLKSNLSHPTPQHEQQDRDSDRTRRDKMNALSRRYLRVFSNINVMLILLANYVYTIGLMTNIIHLPARTKEAGWSRDRSAMLLFAFGLVSLITRSTHGWFVDRNYIRPFKLHLVTVLGMTVTAFLNPVSDGYGFLVAYAVVLGTFVGISTPLFIVNTKNVASPSEQPAALSLIWASTFLSDGFGPVVAGKIYDATGSYVAPFLTGGALCLLSFLLLCVVVRLVGIQKQDKLQKPGFPDRIVVTNADSTEDVETQPLGAETVCDVIQPS
ncbi:monocarboxylate transporter 13-like [Patiria miniata]|uniref:Major facilitator superfamily (MFS) profile domain-containing protein n=1 Tax=Patiria miniata TaxID=46514 RepID=A0A914BI62_PATMI|nr:monocarboxylate transporter 13-like [Patiria miniata]XP_038075973.1 monocarboxylate transporter 13-like [Patiria miniata]